MLNKARVDRVIARMRHEEIPVVFISDPESVFYLTGRWIGPGERMLVLMIRDDGRVTLVANRLFAQKGEPGMDLVQYDDTDDCVAVLSGCVEPSIRTVGVDKRWPSLFLLRFMALRPEIRCVLGSGPVDTARMLKDDDELQAMRRSSRLNDEVLRELIASLREGETETEVAARYVSIARAKGASGYSFTPLICFGPNGAEPHHEPDGTRLKKGDAVICDVGLDLESAMSDMTRTVFFGEPTDKMRAVYEIVRKANLAGKAAVRPGVPLRDIDRAARAVIEEAGFGPYFIHRTGHGIGISVHEPPDVSATSDAVAAPGMIFSIEPGIYLPGEFGVRIEDLVAVTPDGCEVLNALEIPVY